MNTMKKITAIILSIMTIFSICTMSASAAGADNTISAGEYIQDYAVDILDEVLELETQGSSSGKESKFIEFFRDIFGYYKIKNTKKLEKAFKNGGKKWVLKKDITVDKTLELNTYLKITGDKKITGGDFVLIKINKSGYLDLFNASASTGKGEVFLNEGKLYLENVKGTSTAGDIVQNRNDCTINKGTYEATASDAVAVWCINGSVTTINGGIFKKSGGTDIRIDGQNTKVYFKGGESVQTYLKEDCTLNMSGGHIGTLYKYGTLNQTGGTIGKIIGDISYKISTESDLINAAKTGGDKWTLEKDITANSEIILTSDSLKIDGKGHTITRTNGDKKSAIFKIDNYKSLKLDNIKMKNTAGRCLTANTHSNAIIGEGGACNLESLGDTIVNYGNVQLSGGTTLNASGTNSVALWNDKVTDATGTATLYYCNLNKIRVEAKGILNLKQSNTVVTSVTNYGTVNMENTNHGDVNKPNITTATNNEGAVWNMSGGHIGTLWNYGKLNKTGGTIDVTKPDDLITQEDAVNWIKARRNENWWKDVDGLYGCQCVDLIMAYYEYLVGYRVKGHAYEYLDNTLPTGWKRDKNPSPGSIIVWDRNTWTGQWTTGTYGHIGLVYSVSGSNVYTVETNTGGTSGSGSAAAAVFKTRLNVNATYIHPNFPISK